MVDPLGTLYCNVAKHLEQGDIFASDFVMPIASQAQRIFRTVSAQHGQLALRGTESGRVFARDELEDALASLHEGQKTAMHTAPFTLTADGHPELVVTHAELRKYFVIATQTCDISGVDKPQLPVAIVLPINTLQDECRRPLPFRNESARMSIHDFLLKNVPNCTLRDVSSPYEYGTRLLDTVAAWSPSDQHQRESRNIIKKVLERARKSTTSVFYLHEDSDFNMPESVIDFTSAYTVTTDSLARILTKRIARINNPWREHFAHSFANFIGRVAVPALPQPKPLG